MTDTAPPIDPPAERNPGPKPKAWIDQIAAYVPGKAADDSGRQLVKLSANENPLGCSPAAAQALRDAASAVDRYPDGGATELRAALGARYDLDPDRIICGTGSDDVLQMAANAFTGPGDEVVHVRYGFAVYGIAARRYGGSPVVAPDDDYGTDVDALLDCVTEATRLVFVANPNNPTGTLIPRDEVRRLHASLSDDVLLVMDGAYAEYLDEDDGALDLARTAPNVLATRTFSKIHGLAAERIGWGTAAAPVIEAMNRIRQPFNVTTAGQLAARAALSDEAFVARSKAHNAEWRDWLTREIDALGNHGLRVVPSHANFILVLFEGKLTAARANAVLMEAGYVVRWLPGQGLTEGLRITIGTEEETRGVAAAMREIVETTE